MIGRHILGPAGEVIPVRPVTDLLCNATAETDTGQQLTCKQLRRHEPAHRDHGHMWISPMPYHTPENTE